ncbi:uncharacterized protein RCO7_08185 [Rhynchosporium graminicola]|uniref:Integral membrane protein n=1 Tax=Rhynchosporium graminicola TaxID=2792576 RepID=A0A1E1LD85_9HELO|nr:uncharacterized protein RCO7_08185 [Rhynchosporium commune]
MQPPTLLIIFSVFSIISSTAAQTNAAPAAAAPSPDGLIVPFKSGLPVCASKCGPLFDVQGKCSPPFIAAVDNECFCTDSRLTPLDNDNGVSLVCGAESCQDPTQQQAVKTWYDGLCKKKQAGPPQVVTSTASDGATTIQTNASKPKPATGGAAQPSWMSSHYKWVIMIVIIFCAIVFGWIGACIFRRRYLRKKEKEIEMAPPIAWGPHQMQGATGGYAYGDGVMDANKGGPRGAGGHAKEYAAAAVTPADGRKAERGTFKGNVVTDRES